jgi:poly-gamma-glutamate capsule biosynthesis protein CapA/YwtB (metallophosphatase superfamily)
VRDGLVTVLLGGDVMLGRGLDQILPHPGDPRLWERYLSRRYGVRIETDSDDLLSVRTG